MRIRKTFGVKCATKSLNDLVFHSESLKRATKQAGLLATKTKNVFPLLVTYERLNNQAVDEPFFEVKENSDMQSSLGEFCMIGQKIYIREDMYNDALSNGKEGLFTMAHEFSHLALHNSSVLPRSSINSALKWQDCAEAQADALAIELLIDRGFIIKNFRKYSIEYFSELFRIPIEKLKEHVERMIENGDIVVQLELDIS